MLPCSCVSLALLMLPCSCVSLALLILLVPVCSCVSLALLMLLVPVLSLLMLPCSCVVIGTVNVALFLCVIGAVDVALFLCVIGAVGFALFQLVRALQTDFEFEVRQVDFVRWVNAIHSKTSCCSQSHRCLRSQLASGKVPPLLVC